MNVVLINLEENMGMTDFFHLFNVWMIFCCNYMFLINKASIKMMNECFILSLNLYG
jgi:hypothetical protein